ncbi:hypothetical protein ACJMK2_036161 [Sinanodonta woodiana]|uniref:Uncharacterized protein n=1 Tax=Sinanodonta woodiana TaxID=1069815 RepID=A0ABD3WGK2_SINWO
MGPKMSASHTGKSEGRGAAASDGDVFPLTELPDELLEGVLSHLPGLSLVTSCCYVCKKWNELIQSQGLWKEKCHRENYVIPSCHSSYSSIDFRKIYFLNPYGRNLLKNPDATNGFANWKILQNGGDQFTCEKEAVGINPIFQYAPVEGHVPCWVTSYTECKKTQLVDLIQCGCSADVLDELQPAIEISEWYGGRFDCGVQYNINVRLLSEDACTVLDEFKFEDTKPAGRDWFHVSHMFQNYGKGLKYIQYTHGGQDTQFWAGHYGVKITLSSIMFNFSENSPRKSHKT